MLDPIKCQETYMITTIDNPYNPFKDFSNWYIYDLLNNYNTTETLGRIVQTSESFSPQENNFETEKAIDEMISLDFENIYIKVTENNFDEVIKRFK